MLILSAFKLFIFKNKKTDSQSLKIHTNKYKVIKINQLAANKFKNSGSIEVSKLYLLPFDSLRDCEDDIIARRSISL